CSISATFIVSGGKTAYSPKYFVDLISPKAPSLNLVLGTAFTCPIAGSYMKKDGEASSLNRLRKDSLTFRSGIVMIQPSLASTLRSEQLGAQPLLRSW